MTGALDHVIVREFKALRRGRVSPITLSASVATASVGLLGLSGWFLAGAALAGAAGTLAALAFNYMLPAAAIRLMAIARTGARYGERLVGHMRALTVMARVRGALYRGIALMPPAQALALGRGEATARLVQDVEAIEGALVRRPARWAAAAAILGTVALAAFSDWMASLVIAIGFGIAAAIAYLLVSALAQPGRLVQRENGALKNLLAEHLAAAPELRCFGLADAAVTAIEASATALTVARNKRARAVTLLGLLGPAAGMIIAASVLLAAAKAGPALAALAALSALAAGSELGGWTRALAERDSVEEAARRLDDYLSIRDPMKAVIALGDHPTVEIKSQRATVDGRLIVLSGASGTGKTTVAETLVGLRQASAGMARVGGVDIALIPPASLRAIFAWMPQDAQLLTGTVRDNLALARPDGDDMLFWAALEDAMIADRVRAMPSGLDSWVGENGEALSGGERRRLALARAYCADAPWLLLDEPFESIDPATASLMAERMMARMILRDQRVILISHGNSGDRFAPQLRGACHANVEHG
jgi:ATP-binding cassette subfamily C protein CydC